MIPIASLITPYQAPPQAPPGMAGNALGDLGDFLQHRKENEVATEIQRQRDAANQSQQSRHLDETTRYHDLLYKEHDAAQADKRNAAANKTREHLFDRLHKAKTPDEKLSVIQEFKRLGDTVEEGASAFKPAPGPVDEGKAANTAPAKMQRATTGKAPQDKETTQLSPQEEQAFQAWAVKHGIRDVDHPDAHYDYRGAFKDGLEPGPDHHWPDTYKQHGHESFSEESRYSAGPGDGGTWKGNKLVQPKSKRIEPPEFAGYDLLAGGADRKGSLGASSSYATFPDSEGNQSPPPPAGTAPPTQAKRPMPPEIAALVPEGATAAKPSAPEPPGSGGGKFTVRDKDGNIIHEYDAPAEKQKVLSQITAMGAPFVQNAGFPEDETAAKAAAEYASALVGVLPPDKIPEAYLKAYQANLSGYKKKHIEGQEGRVGGGGPSKQQLQMESKADDVTFKTINHIKTDVKTADAEIAKAGASQALAHLENAEDGGLSQLGAVKSYLQSVSGKVVTDREMSQFLGATGAPNAWEAKLQYYIDGGKRPPEFLRQLTTLLRTIDHNAQQRLDAAGQRAYDMRVRFDGDTDQADIARGAISGHFESAVPEARTSRAPRKPVAAPPAAASPTAIPSPTTPAAPAPAAGGMTLDQWRAAQRGKK